MSSNLEALTDILDTAVDERKKCRKRLEVILKNKAEYDDKSAETIRSRQGVFKDGSDFKMDWFFSPKYMEEYQPETEDPKQVCSNIQVTLDNIILIGY